MNTSKKHIYFFDYLRIFAAFGVVYMHTAAGILRESVSFDWELINILTSLAFTAVPLFFMMSGYLLLSSERTKDISVLLKKRLPRLIVPLAAWTVVAVLLNCYRLGQLNISGIVSGLLSALSEPAAVHFWFLYTLIAMYALSPLLYGAINSLDKKGHIYVLSIIALVTLQVMLTAVLPENMHKAVNIDVIAKLKFFGGNLCSFILGYYLGHFEKRLPNKILLPAAVILLAIIAFGTHSLTVRNGEFADAFLNQSAGFEVLLASCIFLLFKQNLNRPSRLTELFPAVNLLMGIYLMHNLLITLFANRIRAYTCFDTIWLTAANFAICYLAVKTAASIKPLCYIVNGISFEDACVSCNWQYTVKRIREARNERIHT